MIWDWLESVEHGEFRAELCPLRLFNDTVAYEGQGILSCDRDAGCRIEAFTDGGGKLIHGVLSGRESCKYGEVLPDSYYLHLQAETRDGWQVEIDRIPPDHFHEHSGHPTVVWQIPDGGIFSPVKLTAENQTKIHDSTLAIASPLDLDYWPRVSKTTYDNPRFREERSSLDWLEYDTAFGKITAQRRANNTVRVIIDHKHPDCAAVLNAFRMAFGFASGGKVNILAAETYDSKTVTRHLKWPSSPVRSRRFTTPLGPGMRGISPEPLLAKATEFFAAERSSYVSNMLHACLDSTDNAFTTHAMVVCVTVEGLIKEMSQKPEKKTEVSNVLKDWAARKVLNVKDADELAWRQLRNPSTHGKLLLLDKNDIHRQLPALDRVKNLVVKLVLQVINYDGPYFDHVAGTRLTFPKADPSDL